MPTREDLQILQAQDLELKIMLTKQRIGNGLRLLVRAECTYRSAAAKIARSCYT